MYLVDDSQNSQQSSSQSHTLESAEEIEIDYSGLKVAHKIVISYL